MNPNNLDPVIKVNLNYEFNVNYLYTLISYFTFFIHMLASRLTFNNLLDVHKKINVFMNMINTKVGI